MADLSECKINEESAMTKAWCVKTIVEKMTLTERKLMRSIDKKGEEVRSVFDVPGLIGTIDPNAKTKKEPIYENFADFVRKNFKCKTDND